MKVEYILGFGAAAVIVLTIIIVLILYLILQCRGQQRKRRAARRRAAGLCDTSSGGGAGDSYLERSTVDFIVPGIFEKDKILFQSFVKVKRCVNAYQILIFTLKVKWSSHRLLGQCRTSQI